MVGFAQFIFQRRYVGSIGFAGQLFVYIRRVGFVRQAALKAVNFFVGIRKRCFQIADFFIRVREGVFQVADFFAGAGQIAGNFIDISLQFVFGTLQLFIRCVGVIQIGNGILQAADVVFNRSHVVFNRSHVALQLVNIRFCRIQAPAKFGYIFGDIVNAALQFVFGGSEFFIAGKGFIQTAHNIVSYGLFQLLSLLVDFVADGAADRIAQLVGNGILDG